ncbi:hypothetical protein C5746_04240 [Streptomyces atratus]|uniref:Uncharacterized protein n=1 Tax=Streptomyces atratus TaxID=1893 RepID=A0A2Z5J8Q0_STRAR|nr:hypothetical protein C5746_04240 [Streptomyces atratus]
MRGGPGDDAESPAEHQDGPERPVVPLVVGREPLLHTGEGGSENLEGPVAERGEGLLPRLFDGRVDRAPSRAASRMAASRGLWAGPLFLAHPDAGIVAGFPGLCVLSEARVLAEIGDGWLRPSREIRQEGVISIPSMLTE